MMKCKVCGKAKAQLAGDRAVCLTCVWTKKSLGDCPVCDLPVHDGTKHVVKDDYTYHDKCYTFFLQWKWALDNPLI